MSSTVAKTDSLKRLKSGRMKSKPPGRFVVLDGPDGAGKSTQAKLLLEQLKAHGKTALLLREPGGTDAGEAIRSLLLEKRKHDNLSALAETFLFQAARAQLIQEVIKPALAKGTWVICDRFTLSTLVYQGLAGGVKRETVETLSALAADGVKPDRYMVLWLPAADAANRRTGRGTADRMESKGETFLKAVSQAYKTLAGKNDQYRRIDASGTVDEVRQRIWNEVESLIGKKSGSRNSRGKMK